MSTSYIGTRTCGLVHIAERPIADVLAGHFRARITINGVTYSVNQRSLRYKVFAKSQVRCCCGIVRSVGNCRLGVKSSSAYKVSPRPHRRAARADGTRFTGIYVQTGS
jgi:hypothetical protein